MPSTAIDWNLCVEIMAGKEDFAREILEKFVQQLIIDKQSIVDQFTSPNYSALYQTLHKLHGACCYCGVPKLKSLVKQFEIEIKDGNYKNLAELYGNTIQEIDLIIMEYEDFFIRSSRRTV